LFGSPRWAWLWLIARVYIGYTWLNSGIGKLSNPGWTVTGEALKGFWTNAVKILKPGAPGDCFDWYRTFIQSMLDGGHYVVFESRHCRRITGWNCSDPGRFVGIAAFLGAFLNWNFMMAGTQHQSADVCNYHFLILAWKNAGWLGLDVGCCQQWELRGGRAGCLIKKLPQMHLLVERNMPSQIFRDGMFILR